jgi:hypothetical protein
MGKARVITIYSNVVFCVPFGAHFLFYRKLIISYKVKKQALHFAAAERRSCNKRKGVKAWKTELL